MHIPVLLNEVLQYLQPKPGDNFIDCTVGEGGHALAILKMIAPDGKLLGIDRDADMVEILKVRAADLGVADRFTIHQGNFADINNISEEYKFHKVNGVLFDFGMSSWQIEESGAGFSFQNVEPLDMRYDRTKGAPTAANILNSWPKESISRIIYEFGEERYARRIADEIFSFRRKEHITTTDQLVSIISRAIPDGGKKRMKIHFATKTFQALRIAVNTELENIEIGIEAAIKRLEIGGRVAAITFHSLEDRIVKNIFKYYSRPHENDEDTNLNRAEGPQFRADSKRGVMGNISLQPHLSASEVRIKSGLVKIITKKPIRPIRAETMENPRARSAKLRVAEKIGY